MHERTSTSARDVLERLPVCCLLAALAWAAPGGSLQAQEGEHPHDHSAEAAQAGHTHGSGLHFTHPMIAESVSPDTKVRLDHQYFEFPDGDTEHSGVLETEYAFARSFSVEAGLPYSYSAGAFGNAQVLLKFANYAFEEEGVLLGYGLEFGFPTNGAPEGHEHEEEHEHEHSASGVPEGAERGPAGAAAEFPPDPRFHGGTGVEGTLGTEEWEVAPFLNVGYRNGALELVGWGIFGIPFGQAEQSEVGTELSWNLSGLYHVSPRVQALVELDGSGGVSGPEVGEDVVNLSPGVRVRVLPDEPLVVGTSVGFPVASGAEEDPFDLRWKTSLFWHF